jgi:hypothetical protein
MRSRATVAMRLTRVSSSCLPLEASRRPHRVRSGDWARFQPERPATPWRRPTRTSSVGGTGASREHPPASAQRRRPRGSRGSSVAMFPVKHGASEGSTNEVPALARRRCEARERSVGRHGAPDRSSRDVLVAVARRAAQPIKHIRCQGGDCIVGLLCNTGPGVIDSRETTARRGWLSIAAAAAAAENATRRAR